MPAAIDILPLAQLGALRIRGADAAAYLQGQLSGDLRLATPGAARYSGFHTAQGRVLARLAVVLLGDADWLAILPASLVAPVATALQRFVLRSRLTIAAAPACAIAVAAGELPNAAADAHVIAPPPLAVLPQGAVTLRFTDGRQCCYSPEGWPDSPAGTPPAIAAAAAWRAWQAREVALGLGEVYPETSGSFVSQMLNFDCIGAIAFDKGCYTGQEVIARAHYRGRVKRRLQRFAARAPLGLAPGAALRLADGRSALLVREALQADGSSEFLAVCALPSATSNSATAEPAQEPETGAAEAAASSRLAPIVAASVLPLPYALPE
jgi:folate-binding protein YgfZ